MKKTYIFIPFAIIALLLSGCNFLDKNPDDRAEINSRKKVHLLLVNGYEMPNIAPLCETMSDNCVDNNTPDDAGQVVSVMPLSLMYNQYFAWDDVTTDSQQDSPYYIWMHCYKNIAVANQALNAIDKLEAESGERYDAERAEALLIRAWNHFILANIFCKAYRTDDLSSQDLGIHYMTEPETEVNPQYERGTLTETYKHIQADLEEALPKVSDEYYSVPKYHFNTKAAHAFAAKFYLFIRNWDEAINQANMVLGTSSEEASAMMFDAAAAKLLGNPTEELHAWMSATSPSNLLITTTMSTYERTYRTSYARYTLNRNALKATLTGWDGSRSSGPAWDGRFPGCNIWRINANYGSFKATIIEEFEYTDKVAGIGYPRILRRELTAGETLLIRAEAKVMKGDLSGAVEDMNVWCLNYCCEKELTASAINKFFPVSSEGRIPQHIPTLHNQDMAPDWIITDEQKPYIWCALHLNRIETLHEGYRWWDIKRYGIELKHEIGYPIVTKTLTWDDDRRAAQLPQETILAGQQPNPRETVGDHNTTDASMGPNNTTDVYLPNTGYTPVLVPFN